MNHNNVSIIEEEDDDHIDISMERDISYYSTPLRETPATMFHTFVAKWLVRREGMNLFVFERSRRLLSRGSMLFQPWDIWLGQTSRASQGQIYYAREDRLRNVNESAKLEGPMTARSRHAIALERIMVIKRQLDERRRKFYLTHMQRNCAEHQLQIVR